MSLSHKKKKKKSSKKYIHTKSKLFFVSLEETRKEAQKNKNKCGHRLKQLESVYEDLSAV